jgi:hypothetical protein
MEVISQEKNTVPSNSSRNTPEDFQALESDRLDLLVYGEVSHSTPFQYLIGIPG